VAAHPPGFTLCHPNAAEPLNRGTQAADLNHIPTGPSKPAPSAVLDCVWGTPAQS